MAEGMEGIAPPELDVSTSHEEAGQAVGQHTEVDDLSTKEIIESEGKRLANSIIVERQKVFQEGKGRQPGEIFESYDIAMKLNMLRGIQATKASEGPSQDPDREQNRQAELAGLKKAQTDLLADFYTKAVVKGEGFLTNTNSMIEDISQVGKKANLFRVDQVVRQEIHKEIMQPQSNPSTPSSV